MRSRVTLSFLPAGKDPRLYAPVQMSVALSLYHHLMRGGIAKATFVTASLALVALSVTNGALNGYSISSYLVILAAGFVLLCSSFMKTGE